jgi:Na+-transporting NADH:ubiquinone oxidoreductase subunit B
MSPRDILDSIEPYFTKGARFEKYYGLYEMVDTFIYTPADVTRGTTHVRDSNDLKRT